MEYADYMKDVTKETGQGSPVDLVAATDSTFMNSDSKGVSYSFSS
jgi:hypothetical protein